VDLLSDRIRRRYLQKANCQNLFGEDEKRKQKLDAPGDIMYVGFHSLFVLVGSTKRGTFKQMAAVAMDKNGNP
jgi:hypothetical protein